jgi:hypothetical protein
LLGNPTFTDGYTFGAWSFTGRKWGFGSYSFGDYSFR